MGADWIELQLLGISFYNASFRCTRDTALEPAAGHLYTIDEMADDMNADKALASAANAGADVLYRWMVARPAERSVAPQMQADCEAVAAMAGQLERPHRLTGPQHSVVAGNLQHPLLLVQGPPGTDKSHTLAWAAQPFDLLVIDEASQMSIPEAVVAARSSRRGAA